MSTSGTEATAAVGEEGEEEENMVSVGTPRVGCPGLATLAGGSSCSDTTDDKADDAIDDAADDKAVSTARDSIDAFVTGELARDSLGEPSLWLDDTDER
jgi:hypothetical protein